MSAGGLLVGLSFGATYLMPYLSSNSEYWILALPFALALLGIPIFIAQKRARS
jgi:hypothetical protein